MVIKNKFLLKIAALIESLVITATFIILSRMFNDPLSLNNYFPWIWFGPVLIALRYGIVLSQISVIILLVTFLQDNPAKLYDITFQMFLLGGFLLTLICGISQHSWLKKINTSDGISLYLQKRIQTIAYAYNVVKLAYSRLEHNFISKPVTIRSSLDELRNMHAKENDSSLQTILNRLLNILSLQCSLEIAGIFLIKDKKFIKDPITSIGIMKPINENDYLIKTCLETHEMNYIKANEILKGHITEYLVVVPFVDQDKNLYALLVIKEMPFLSLNNENLGVLNLLIQYFLEGNPVKNADLILKQYPDCPIDFANELLRLFNLFKYAKKDSAIVAFIFFNTPHRDDYLFKLKSQKRGIDSEWQTTHGDIKTLFVLMPFINRAGVEIYKERINAALTNTFGVGLNSENIKCRSTQLSSFDEPLNLIQDLLNIT